MATVQKEKIARRKLSLLQLAEELGNVSKACQIVGYSRQQPVVLVSGRLSSLLQIGTSRANGQSKGSLP